MKNESSTIASNKKKHRQHKNTKRSKNDKPLTEAKSKKKGVVDEIKNLTKEIEYVTSNNNGDIYKISAKYGRTNLKDNSVLIYRGGGNYNF